MKVQYRPRRGARPHVFRLPSTHVDPTSENPGWVYDFYVQRSNFGPIVTLTVR